MMEIFKSVELLKEYFRSTPKEEAEALWKSVEALKFEGPTVADLLGYSCLEEWKNLPSNDIEILHEQPAFSCCSEDYSLAA